MHTDTPSIPPEVPGSRLFTRQQRICGIASTLIGLLAGVLCYAVLLLTNGQSGDFGWALRAANDLLMGRDVYSHPFGADIVPYPLPAAFVALPLAAFPPPIAAGIFFGVSSMLLAWCLLQNQYYWWLLLFLSWPYVYCLLFVQWSPLIMCMAFVSPLLPLLLIKPQIAIPLLVLHPFSRKGIALLFLVGLCSLALYPTWPLVWLSQVRGYKGTSPPLFSLPFGPLALLALLRYRDRRAWFFLVMALMPQRVVYDQLPLLLLARSRGELAMLVLCSWITLPALLLFDGWMGLPGGWQNWIVLTLYVPALLLVLRHRA